MSVRAAKCAEYSCLNNGTEVYGGVGYCPVHALLLTREENERLRAKVKQVETDYAREWQAFDDKRTDLKAKCGEAQREAIRLEAKVSQREALLAKALTEALAYSPSLTYEQTVEWSDVLFELTGQRVGD